MSCRLFEIDDCTFLVNGWRLRDLLGRGIYVERREVFLTRFAGENVEFRAAELSCMKLLYLPLASRDAFYVPCAIGVRIVDCVFLTIA